MGDNLGHTLHTQITFTNHTTPLALTRLTLHFIISNFCILNQPCFTCTNAPFIQICWLLHFTISAFINTIHKFIPLRTFHYLQHNFLHYSLRHFNLAHKTMYKIHTTLLTSKLQILVQLLHLSIIILTWYHWLPKMFTTPTDIHHTPHFFKTCFRHISYTISSSIPRDLLSPTQYFIDTSHTLTT